MAPLTIALIYYTQEAGVIYRSKLGSAGTRPKFWGMVDIYMESLYVTAVATKIRPYIYRVNNLKIKDNLTG